MEQEGMDTFSPPLLMRSDVTVHIALTVHWHLEQSTWLKNRKGTRFSARVTALYRRGLSGPVSLVLGPVLQSS